MNWVKRVRLATAMWTRCNAKSSTNQGPAPIRDWLCPFKELDVTKDEIDSRIANAESFVEGFINCGSLYKYRIGDEIYSIAEYMSHKEDGTTEVTVTMNCGFHDYGLVFYTANPGWEHLADEREYIVDRDKTYFCPDKRELMRLMLIWADRCTALVPDYWLDRLIVKAMSQERLGYFEPEVEYDDEKEDE